MKREYREINLEKFVPEEEEKLTKTEKEHIKKQFYESTGITTKGQQKKKQFKWYYIPAACVVFGLCVAITPIRDTAFAKALKSIVGIGEHLGKTEEDTYVTHVDQVKQDKDITITLKDAIASDQQLRCSVLVTNKDKTKTKLKDVQMEDMKINDQEPEENQRREDVSLRVSQTQICFYIVGGDAYQITNPIAKKQSITGISLDNEELDFIVVWY